MTLQQTLAKHQELADFHTDVVKELKAMLPKKKVVIHSSVPEATCTACE